MRSPGLARLLISQLVARFPSGMLSLAVLMHVEQQHHDWTSAGAVLACISIGQGIAGPFTSRLMGKLGMFNVLAVSTIVCAASVVVLALVPMPVLLLAVVGTIAGLSTPPIQPAVRTIYPKVVTSSQLNSLFSVDASAQEMIWVLGPLVATTLSMQVSPALAVIVAAAFMLGGGAWFVSAPEVRQVRIPPSRKRLGRVLKNRVVILATVVGFLLVGACAALEAGIVAIYRTGGEGHSSSLEAGIILAVFAAASLVGGLLLGHRAIRPWSLALRCFVMFLGIAAAALWLNFWWLCAALFIAGLGMAPAIATLFTITSSSVKFSDTAEAYGWMGTGQLIGAALGSAVAGIAMDATGPIGAIVTGAALSLLSAVVPLVFMRALPDMKGRDAGPIPDTAPIPTVSMSY